MTRPDKVAGVKSLTDSTKNVTAVTLTGYRGLSVKQMEELRSALGDGVHYAMVKDKLSKLAFKKTGVEGLDEYFVGPTAIALIGYDGDPVAAAKVVSEFAKENPAPAIKDGPMDRNVMDAEDVEKLASLESREVLLAKSAGVLKALMHRVVAVTVAPAPKAVRTVNTLREKQTKVTQQ